MPNTHMVVFKHTFSMHIPHPSFTITVAAHEFKKYDPKKKRLPVKQRANPNKDPAGVFHRPSDVVVVHGRNLRRTPTELLQHPSIWRDFITIMEQAAEQ